MSEFLRFAIVGLATGGLYSLLAMGIITVHRASGVVNFAHGATTVATGYLLYDLRGHGVPTPLAVVLSIAAGVLIGLLIQLLVMRPLRAASPLTKAIATLAMLVILQSAAALRYGDDPKVPAAWLPTGTVRLFGAAVGKDRLVILVLSVALTGALWLVYRRSTFGLATSAVAENPAGLAALGRSADVIAMVNWAGAGALAGLTGVLLSPITGLQPPDGVILLIPALAAALLGNLSSFPLALAGGLAIGVVQAELNRYADVHGLSDAVPFLAVIAVLVMRGSPLPGRGYLGDRLPKVTSGRPSPVAALVAAVLVAVAVQAILPEEWVIAVSTCLIAAVVLLSLVVVTGYGGQLSLAQMTLAGMAALVAARLRADLDWPVLLAALAGVLAAVPVGLVVGLSAVRTRGVSLAVATLGLAVAAQAMIFSNGDITGAEAGIEVGTASVFGLELDEFFHPRRFALLALAVLVLVALAVLNLRRSAPGRRMVAVRGNERAAASLGVSVVRTKLYAFVVAAVIAGGGGVLMAFRQQTIVFHGFDPFRSINAVVEATLGGVGYVSGAMLGGTMEPGGVGGEVMKGIGIGDWLQLAGGVLLLITILTAPHGLAANAIRDAAKLRERLRPRPRRAEPALPVRSQAHRVGPAHLKVSGLAVGFGARRILHDISFELRAGEVLGVIGANGAGKTTLIDALTGYVRADGRIELDGRDITRLPPHLRGRAGVVRSFQSLELFEDLTVADNLLVACEDAGIGAHLKGPVRPGRPALSALAAAAVQEFRLADALTASPAELSYGRRRLLAISRAVAATPRVLLLDEPAAGLDDADRAELRGLVRRLAEDRGMAVLLIEHDVDLVMAVSDRVLALDFGRIIATGAPDEVRADRQVAAAYLGVDEEAAR